MLSIALRIMTSAIRRTLTYSYTPAQPCRIASDMKFWRCFDGIEYATLVYLFDDIVENQTKG